ncbi:lysophospholipase [Paenibacillus sp. CAA11]|uniref:GDSL-type esterase/lipase family protein n=1 Tax=Paenibacillus sp. CAA11 TaxID=1532905 RepID=UPI000D3398A5|nr:GDSL-type esterase/lipase family protein [Paenibacillus sp. CAA11]AWB42931.1 lysophospholipase [Paenibacillus sp. CAA11]
MGYLYTAIGDSLTTGFGALPGNGFVPVYRRMAENRLRQQITVNNLGVNGLTSGALLERIGHPVYRQALQQAQLITISIGGNDLIQAAKAVRREPKREAEIFRSSLAACINHFDRIIRSIGSLKAGFASPYIVRVVGLYNPYPQIQEASSWVTRFNRQAGGYSSLSYGFADVYGLFYGHEKSLLSFDGIHPNGRGYRKIAERLNSLGYGLL